MERRLFCLPARKCGLGASNPTSFADESYSTSRVAVTVLYDAIVDQYGFSHEKANVSIAEKHHRIMEDKLEKLLGELLNELPADQFRAVKRINEESLSARLTALPIAAGNFDLSEVEFRDALSVW